MKSNYSFITIKNIVVLFAIFILLPNCNLDDKRIGTFGESADINSSKSNHLFKARYTPNRFKLQLLDSSIITIDTAWSEAAWTYNDDGKPNIAEDSGYNVIIPIPKMNDDKFNFELIMADTTKSMCRRCSFWTRKKKKYDLSENTSRYFNSLTGTNESRHSLRVDPPTNHRHNKIHKDQIATFSSRIP